MPFWWVSVKPPVCDIRGPGPIRCGLRGVAHLGEGKRVRTKNENIFMYQLATEGLKN